jgi:hypothetical protein
MSDKPQAEKSVLEAHEEFVQHIEIGSRKIRTLAIITILITGLLAGSYIYQLILGLTGSATIVEVNVSDPALEASEAVLLVLVLAWLIVAVRDFFFVSKLTKDIKQAREEEREIQKRITG